MAKGYSQVEGLDFGETYALVARLESIRILLAYATYHGFKLYQMDVKSAFLGRLVAAGAPDRPPGGLGAGPLGRGSVAGTAGTALSVVRPCPEPLPAGPASLLD